jgi:hypothetical protein
MVGAGGRLSEAIGVLSDFFRQAWRAEKVWLSSVWDAAKVAIPLLIAGLWALARMLQIVGDHTTTFRIILDILIARFIFLQTIKIVEWFIVLAEGIGIVIKGLRALTVAEIVQAAVGADVIVWLRAAALWTALTAVATWDAIYASWAYDAALWALVTVQTLLSTIMRRALLWILLSIPELLGLGAAADFAAASFTWLAIAVALVTTELWAMLAPLLANPITWIVLGVIALIALLIILYFKWKWFHDLVNETIDYIIKNWPYVLAGVAAINLPLAITIGLIILLIRYYQYWRAEQRNRYTPECRRAAGRWRDDRLRLVYGW